MKKKQDWELRSPRKERPIRGAAQKRMQERRRKERRAWLDAILSGFERRAA